MRSGSARAISANRVSSSCRVASSTSNVGPRSSGIAGKRIWCEGTEDRQGDCLGFKDIGNRGPELGQSVPFDEHGEIRKAPGRLAALVIYDERPGRLANGVPRLLASHLARQVFP